MVVKPVTFEELAQTSFDQLRLYGASNTDIMLRLLGVLSSLGKRATRARSSCEVLSHHASLIVSRILQRLSMQWIGSEYLKSHQNVLNVLAKSAALAETVKNAAVGLPRVPTVSPRRLAFVGIFHNVRISHASDPHAHGALHVGLTGNIASGKSDRGALAR